jgi:hypothetical protein
MYGMATRHEHEHTAGGGLTIHKKQPSMCSSVIYREIDAFETLSLYHLAHIFSVSSGNLFFHHQEEAEVDWCHIPWGAS